MRSLTSTPGTEGDYLACPSHHILVRCWHFRTPGLRRQPHSRHWLLPHWSAQHRSWALRSRKVQQHPRLVLQGLALDLLAWATAVRPPMSKSRTVSSWPIENQFQIVQPDSEDRAQHKLIKLTAGVMSVCTHLASVAIGPPPKVLVLAVGTAANPIWLLP